jgi:hypothetical protein
MKTNINLIPKDGRYTITTESGKEFTYAKTLGEAVYMANFVNTATRLHKGKSSDITPFQSENDGSIDFEHYSGW